MGQYGSASSSIGDQAFSSHPQRYRQMKSLSRKVESLEKRILSASSPMESGYLAQDIEAAKQMVRDINDPAMHGWWAKACCSFFCAALQKANPACFSPVPLQKPWHVVPTAPNAAAARNEGLPVIQKKIVIPILVRSSLFFQGTRSTEHLRDPRQWSLPRPAAVAATTGPLATSALKTLSVFLMEMRTSSRVEVFCLMVSGETTRKRPILWSPWTCSPMISTWSPSRLRCWMPVLPPRSLHQRCVRLSGHYQKCEPTARFLLSKKNH
jgi:hypothetical protein